MDKYDFKKIEKKWQADWKKKGVYEPNLKGKGKRKPFYQLMMFPYPSAEGLHVGNMYAFTGSDVYGRLKRMQGFDVFEPIGLDGFGIHSENYALKVGTHPAKQAAVSEKRFYKQLESIGGGFAWNERLETYDPEYYKWTQWLFIQMFQAGFAYRKKQPVNWCPSCKTVLADEQVIAGKCERCSSVVEKRDLEQWFFRITKYADKLLKNLDSLDWTEKVKIAQKNWIGKSEGAEIDFEIEAPFSGNVIVFASNNAGKVKRMRNLLKAAGLNIELKTPRELGIEDFDVEETGETLRENSQKKAWALRERTKLPILSDDTGFFIKGEKLDPVKVKRNALKGLNEKDLTIEEIAEKMLAFYQGIAAANGGSMDAEWRGAMTILTPEGKVLHSEAVRPVTLTDKPRGKMDVYLPLRPLYIAKATGKYALEQNAKEELMEMAPLTEALKNMIAPSVRVFTTRPDTLFGATYLVLAPEHNLLNGNQLQIENREEVDEYIKVSKAKAEEDRLAEGKEKTGVKLEGVNAVNPATGKKIPVWVADYVLGGYGTGAIMAVPAHDERDAEFAKQFNLPVKEVVSEDVLTNSGKFDGMKVSEAKKVFAKEFGTPKVNFRLRDWLISRQRYWGPPIPMIYCSDCATNGKGERKDMPGWYAEKEKNLPVKLPLVKDFRPKGTGESPLATVRSFYEVKCPACKGKARRETDVSDTFLDSAWYYLRYPNVIEKKRPWDPKIMQKWFPVDMYTGGAEHSVLHLLYVRFVTLLLNDLGLVKFGAAKGGAPKGEPFPRFRAHGLLIKDGAKMSKSKGNVINPDEYIAKFSADVLRMYLMFLAPFEQGGDFRDEGVLGVERYLNGVRRYFSERPKKSASPMKARKALHKAIKKVTEDIENLKYNTAISQLMILFNALEAVKNEGYLSEGDAKEALKLIAPFAPHLTEELWHTSLGQKDSIHLASWPKWDPEMIKDETFTLVVQVNGKVRAIIEAPTGILEAEARELALSDAKIVEALQGQGPKRVIYIPGRLVNIVI